MLACFLLWCGGMTLLPVALSLLILLPEAQWASPIWREPIGPKRAESVAAWQGPVAGRISSRFGVRRHPLSGCRQQHRGIDIAAPLGSTIHAVAAGRVVFAGWRGGYGQLVEMVHAGGWRSRYAHLGTMAVQAGDRLRTGAVLGTVGRSGATTGPHLHMEIEYAGDAIDPLIVLGATATASSRRFLQPR